MSSSDILDCNRMALGTLRHQDTSALNFSAEVSGQFGTGAEVSDGHFGTDLYETLRHHFRCRPTLMHFVTLLKSKRPITFK